MLIGYYDFCVKIKPIFILFKEASNNIYSFSSIKNKSMFYTKFYELSCKTKNFVELNYNSSYTYLLNIKEINKYYNKIIHVENIDKEIERIRFDIRNQYILSLIFMR